MIFYFSGVGNSRWAARSIACVTGDTLHFIPDAMQVGNLHFTLKENEPLGFVFPCYGWSVPAIVRQFVERIQVENVNYVYGLMTCGDDTGLTHRCFSQLLAQKGWRCASMWALQMPESYVCLPGFKTDTAEKRERKYAVAQTRLQRIITAITERKASEHDTLPGAFPWMKTHIIGAFFRRFLITDTPFRTTPQCNGCGRCAAQCPTHNITMRAGRPTWHRDNHCTLCLRCYHACPQHAVQWSVTTRHKEQYMCQLPTMNK